jgi:hypothetical protein
VADSTPRPAEPSADDELDTEGHAAAWKIIDDPRTGGRRLRQEWTPDQPAERGKSGGRVTAPRASKPQR